MPLQNAQSYPRRNVDIKSKAQYDFLEEVSKGKYPNSKITERDALEYLIGVDRNILPDKIVKPKQLINPLTEAYAKINRIRRRV